MAKLVTVIILFSPYFIFGVQSYEEFLIPPNLFFIYACLAFFHQNFL